MVAKLYFSPTLNAAGSIVIIPESGSTFNVQGTVAGAAADSGNPVKAGGVYNTTPPTYTNAQRSDLQVDTRGNLKVSINAADSTNTVTTTTAAADAVTASSIGGMSRAFQYRLNGSTWDRDVKPNAVSRIVSSAASTNATVAKAAAGNLFNVLWSNANAAVRYLKIYNKATAPTVGTDTPILTITLPALTTSFITFDSLYFSTGISYALTTGIADADTGAVSAADILGLNLAYA